MTPASLATPTQLPDDAATPDRSNHGTQTVPAPPTALVEDELRTMAAVQRALVVEGLRDAMQAETDAAQAEALAAVDIHKREMNAANKAVPSHRAQCRSAMAQIT